MIKTIEPTSRKKLRENESRFFPLDSREVDEGGGNAGKRGFALSKPRFHLLGQRVVSGRRKER
jgi:hypothetical protein